jgi:hypothetical protein
VPKMEDNLIKLFRDASLDCYTGERPTIRFRYLEGSELGHEVQSVYRELGGGLPSPPDRVGHWDMVVEDVPVELDESRHFNRYRATTLRSSIYAKVNGFDVRYYARLCDEMESECLRHARFGGYWTNPSCETQFGPSSAPGDLTGGGAPRWKQRAFYDFLKDVNGFLERRHVIRFSIYDSVPHAVQPLGDLLLGDASGSWRGELVAEFIRRRRVAG